MAEESSHLTQRNRSAQLIHESAKPPAQQTQTQTKDTSPEQLLHGILNFDLATPEKQNLDAEALAEDIKLKYRAQLAAMKLRNQLKESIEQERKVPFIRIEIPIRLTPELEEFAGPRIAEIATNARKKITKEILATMQNAVDHFSRDAVQSIQSDLQTLSGDESKRAAYARQIAEEQKVFQDKLKSWQTNKRRTSNDTFSRPPHQRKRTREF